MTAAETRIPFTRTRLTWQAYMIIGYYSYLLNALGPMTPFLRDEMNLSYTLASFHFSAYAIGVVLTSAFLNLTARRFGPHFLLWMGAFGMAGGTLLLILGRHPALTIAGAFFMGLLGVNMVALMNSTLADIHRQNSAIAFSESSTFASLLSALAPLAVGFFARTDLTWRAALGLMALAAPLLWLVYGKDRLTLMDASTAPRGQIDPASASSPMPRVFWFYWFSLLLAVAVEFCIIFWAADYLEKISGLPKADAATAVSAFLGAMLVGRFLNSRLLRCVAQVRVLSSALFFTALGFFIFWLVPAPLPAVLGLTLAGFGVAGLFPILNAQALSTIPGRVIEGNGRISTAVGISILLLPLLLGRLADWTNIRVSYGVVALLIVLLIGLVVVIQRMLANQRRAVQ